MITKKISYIIRKKIGEFEKLQKFQVSYGCI